jgi:hypothetical protein
MTSLKSVRVAARALSGDVSGRVPFICLGPRHDRHDRSLSMRFGPNAPPSK